MSSQTSYSSSSTSSSSTPRIRYFDLLPVEIVRAIVEYAASSQFAASFAYEERQETLLALSSTSKLLHTLAQPLLLSSILIRRDQELKPVGLLVDRNSREALRSMKTIVVGNILSLAIPSFVNLLEAATNLQEVSCCTRPECLEPFLGLNITTLTIDWVKIGSFSHFSFMQLKYLMVQDCSFEKWDRGGRRSGETTFVLPSLRHLAYIETEQISASTVRFLDVAAKTLDSLTVPLDMVSKLPDSLLRSSSITRCFHAKTVDASLYESHAQSVEHLCLNNEQDVPERLRTPEYYQKEIKNLEKWTRLIGSSPTLKSLTIPSHEILKYITDYGNTFRHELSSILEACRNRCIKVYIQERELGETFWEYVSQSLVSWSEARKHSGA